MVAFFGLISELVPILELTGKAAQPSFKNLGLLAQDFNFPFFRTLVATLFKTLRVARHFVPRFGALKHTVQILRSNQSMEAELVLASSPTDMGISCWDLRSGSEHLRFRSCSSPPHGLTSVAGRFIASSQVRESKSSSGSILYWSWNKVLHKHTHNKEL